ncbi:MAG: phosphopantetheine-binding protein [Proteobacteria bacterium ST_bin11]|nr:MAG: phosphopantetheine-binding protein [Proteobacteria bacterium ST_bin11]
MKETLKNFIFAELIYHEDPTSFGDEDNLLDAGLDSMGIMRLIMFAEKEFGVTLPDTEIEPDNVGSLKSLESWIRRSGYVG